MQKLKKLVFAGSGLLVMASFKSIDDPAEIKCSNKNLLEKVVRKSPEFDKLVYKPRMTLLNGHIPSWMTGIKTKYNRYYHNALKFDRNIFVLSDGAEIAIDSNSDPKFKGKPLIVIIPGLMSSCFDHYHHTLIEAAMKSGYDWKLINYRGVTHKMSTGIPFTTNDFESFKEPLKYIIGQN